MNLQWHGFWYLLRRDCGQFRWEAPFFCTSAVLMRLDNGTIHGKFLQLSIKAQDTEDIIQDAYKNRIGRSYTEYEQYRQLNLFEDFGNYNKEQQLEHENSIENNTGGTEAPTGATVPDYRIENQPQSNVNIEEGVDDNGNNEENTSTNLGITGQMGFH